MKIPNRKSKNPDSNPGTVESLSFFTKVFEILKYNKQNIEYRYHLFWIFWKNKCCGFKNIWFQEKFKFKTFSKIEFCKNNFALLKFGRFICLHAFTAYTITYACVIYVYLMIWNVRASSLTFVIRLVRADLVLPSTNRRRRIILHRSTRRNVKVVSVSVSWTRLLSTYYF